MGQDCQIIVTDDDADDRNFLAEAFERNQFRGDLLEAGNGLQLFSILESKQSDAKKIWPDVIILDLNMPVLNGYEVLDRLSQDDGFRNTRVVVLTSSSKKEDETRCTEAGCLKYYKKPFRLSGYDEIARDILSLIRPVNPCC
jgi:CheY-like chemotaxis protein